MEELFTSLHSRIYRHTDLHSVMMELKEFLEKFFFSDYFSGKSNVQALHHYIDENDLPVKVVDILRSIPDSFLDRFGANTLYDQIARLEELLSQTPLLTIYVPVELEPEHYEHLGNWVREHVNPQLVFDTKLDSTVIGGCAFVWNGTYHDYSLRYFIKQNHQEIIEALHNEHQHAGSTA
jgi:F0F1-type ATP synthase delta subunit